MPATGNAQGKALRRDIFVALLCGAFVAVMGGLSYAAVPFYSWFCRASGFGGSEVALSRQPSPRLLSVRFDSDACLPRSFWPSRNGDDARLGQLAIVSYRRTNQSGRLSVVEAGYSSPSVGLYFEKIDCRCFAPQIMRLAASRDVVLYPDPERADDSDQHGVSTITLFYTFYLVRAPVPSAQHARPPASGPARLTGRI